ncbi:MAG TPA: glycosyltransferase family 1 protein [Methylovirgula sp.]
MDRHVRQFYWTVTRLVGLGHLHDGAKNRSPARPCLAQDAVEQAAGPRILIDATPTHRHDDNTGIQRVVREIGRASIAHAGAFPVVIERGRLLSYFRHPALPDVVQIETGDQLLLLDSSWSLLDEYLPIVQDVSRRGGSIICGIHDLIPLLYPGTVSIGTTQAIRAWLSAILPYCAAVVTISRSVAEDFLKYVSEHQLPCNPSIRVGWFHLGADFTADAGRPVSPQIRDVCERTPFFLTIGTIEPRKNHGTALKAFEALWAAGIDVHYVIVGKIGWLSQSLRQRILEHPEFGRRLFWLQSAGDGDLSYLYQHAAASIQPSIAEGFGLPIIEAARFGTRVIASDIRVFHEIAGDAVTYFDPMDAGALAARIKEELTNPSPMLPIAILSWKEATARLLQLIRDEAYPYTLAGGPVEIR